MEPASVNDLRIIARQLGRAPRGVRGIALRCPYGYPQVIVVHPIVDGKPFPTMFWLTCPLLSKEIDRLEAGGMIAELEGLIRTDSELAARLTSAHRAYIEERLVLLSEREREHLKERGMFEALAGRGIGGIADFSRVKCLHLHVAHALAEENPIGRIVLERIPQRACRPDRVICSRFDEHDAPGRSRPGNQSRKRPSD